MAGPESDGFDPGPPPPDVAAGSGGEPRAGMPAGLPEDKLPFAPDAERGVIGAVLMDPTLFNTVSQETRAADFFRDAHRRVFETMEELSERGVAPDYTSVVEELRDAKRLEAIGGETALFAMVDNAAPSGLIEQYARIVRDRAVSRHLIRTAQLVVQVGLSGRFAEAGEYQQYAEGRLLEALKDTSRGSVLEMREILSDTVDHIEKLVERDENITGISTGFMKLDGMTLGMHGGELLVVAARPAMGKSALALNIAAHASLFEKKAVLLFSLEMSSEQLGMRMLAQEGRVDLARIRAGNLISNERENDWDKINDATRRLRDARIRLDVTPSLNVADIRARARRLHAQEECDLVVVDYLQLVSARPGTDSREQAVADVSRSLKHLAMELQIPVIALSQLNRGVESRTDKRPLLGDLRESGAIEQDADVILFIYRDEVYRKDSPEKGIAELILAKQRNGPTGTVKVRFNGPHTRFDNIDPGFIEHDTDVRISGIEPEPAAPMPPPPEPMAEPEDGGGGILY